MERTTGFLLRLVAASASLAAGPARADEVQFWLNESASFPVAPGWSGQVTAAQRIRSGPDQYVLRANAERKINDWLRIGGGMTRSWSRGYSEWRPNQDVAVSNGPLSLRLRLEERFIAGAARAALRFRPRLQVSVPMGLVTSAQASGELFYALRSQDRGRSGEIDQYRLAAGLTRKLGPALEGGLSYTYIVTPRPGKDRKVHAPGAAVGLRF